MITPETKEKARQLFMQDELNRTQISEQLDIDRRTLNKWIDKGEWERMRHAAKTIPMLMIERCYHIFGLHSFHLLHERKLNKPITFKDVDVLYRLACTIDKLSKRASLNESMEALTFYTEHLKEKDPELAKAVAAHTNSYLEHRTTIRRSNFYPPDQTGPDGSFPEPTDEQIEVGVKEWQADQDEADQEYFTKEYGHSYPNPDEEEEETIETTSTPNESVAYNTPKEEEPLKSQPFSPKAPQSKPARKPKPTTHKKTAAHKHNTNITPVQKRHK